MEEEYKISEKGMIVSELLQIKKIVILFGFLILISKIILLLILLTKL